MEQITHPFVRKSVFIGVLDRNLKKIEARLGVELTIRGDSLNIGGPAEKTESARLYFDRIRQLEEKGHDLKEEDFQIILDLLEQGRTKPVEDYFPAEPLSFARKSVSPKSLNQQEYIQSIRTHDLVFDLVSAEQAQRLIDKNIIEIAPLAYMRGRTLNSAFIILDEAQNTTRPQMKMFLTRAGYDSKVVVTADITQIALPHPKDSGLLPALKILSPLKEIAFCRFDEKDVVRHPLVQKIIKAY